MDCSLSVQRHLRKMTEEPFTVFWNGGPMGAEPPRDVTLILGRARAGDDQARSELISVVYEELRHVAARLMKGERPGHTLPPTAVVHEAVIRLLGGTALDKAPDRNYLFAAAARAMREVLIEHARQRTAGRRGGGWQRVPLDLVVDYFEEQGLDVVAVHEALDRLAELNERQSRVMTLRYFGGLTVPEVAAALEVSVVTVERDWRLARAWLRRQLREEGANETGTLAPD
jgi:RNA polymerase sigma-70 factor, ECF subfamily